MKIREYFRYDDAAAAAAYAWNIQNDRGAGFAPGDLPDACASRAAGCDYRSIASVVRAIEDRCGITLYGPDQGLAYWPADYTPMEVRGGCFIAPAEGAYAQTGDGETAIEVREDAPDDTGRLTIRITVIESDGVSLDLPADAEVLSVLPLMLARRVLRARADDEIDVYELVDGREIAVGDAAGPWAADITEIDR